MHARAVHTKWWDSFQHKRSSLLVMDARVPALHCLADCVWCASFQPQGHGGNLFRHSSVPLLRASWQQCSEQHPALQEENAMTQLACRLNLDLWQGDVVGGIRRHWLCACQSKKHKPGGLQGC